MKIKVCRFPLCGLLLSAVLAATFALAPATAQADYSADDVAAATAAKDQKQLLAIANDADSSLEVRDAAVKSLSNESRLTLLNSELLSQSPLSRFYIMDSAQMLNRLPTARYLELVATDIMLLNPPWGAHYHYVGNLLDEGKHRWLCPRASGCWV